MTADRPNSVIRAARDAAADALRFFTRIPVPPGWGSPDPAAIFDGVARAAPLAGLVVGAVGGAVLAALTALGLSPLPAATLAVAAGVALSGALHEDGLADVADGFGGGRDRERKLAIMRDSRLGSFGATALILTLLGRVSLVAALAEGLGPVVAGLAVAAASTIARPAAVLPTVLLPPARSDGAGHAARPSPSAVALGWALGAALAALLAGIGPGLAAAACAALAASALSALARRQIGGVTGDVCGAAAALGDAAALTALALTLM
ncbi:adenosylcobinamide-GDP ribazoletransferase [Methylopila capsulata]|uniref:Adenosylcobinamide-GDP ribazoletransferase n=1 Tax=Methylopila capsulata TaxID=61654 RepID=A0A9W6IUS5_9HYPH|nr:adenosylcobinamide-GDP ribazoletransferase [Methylopila capsulata]MBM7850267.1 adenosylcobinamide-GDP ribazoletransferase [Methylopila capsulata]GLK55560.1 adenosylcobinamide-GDP ribazoletransferase [Methylopila capsulata]